MVFVIGWNRDHGLGGLFFGGIFAVFKEEESADRFLRKLQHAYGYPNIDFPAVFFFEEVKYLCDSAEEDLIADALEKVK